MQNQYNNCEEPSQEEFDGEAFVAEINAILAAPRREPTLEEQRLEKWRFLYSFDHLFGLARHTQTREEYARAQTMLEELHDEPEPFQPRYQPGAEWEPGEWELDEGLEAEEVRGSENPTPALDVVLDLQSDPAPVRQSENRRPRRSGARDRRSVDRSRTCFEEELARQRKRDFSRNPPPSSLTNQNDNEPTSSNDNEEKKNPTTKKARADENDRRGISSWKDTKDFGKFVAMNRAAALNDNDWCAEPYAFTLNLSPDVIARALASRHNGFASFMQKRIAAELAKVMRRVVEFAFKVDVTPCGRPHLHGVGVMNDNELPAFHEALRRAGGAWAAKGGERQVNTRLMWDADGWASYSARNAAAARRVVGSSIMACTAGLKSQAKALHEHLRQSARAAAA